MRLLLLSLIISTGMLENSCGQKDPVRTFTLTEPKSDTIPSARSPGKSLSVILLSDSIWWCYTDSNYEVGHLYDTLSFGKLLIEKKKEWADSFVVFIKPPKTSSYKASVNALDMMTRYNIKTYVMIGLTTKENNFFYSQDFLQPPPPVEIQTPKSVTIQELPEDNAFLIEIRKDRSVWYQVISKVSKMVPQKINMPITKNLEEIIAGYEKSETGGQKKYLIKADGNSTKYHDFEQVIEALKANNIFKYNLVTSLEDQ
jgi:biopolymer transport protein ExbD